MKQFNNRVEFSAKVYIDPICYQEIMYYVDKCDKEVGGLGRVKKVGNDFYVSKVYLLDQEVSGASTDLDAEAVAKCMFETQNDEELHGELAFQWHSHVNMAVFWSNVDLDTIKEIGQGGLCVATVFNKRQETRTGVYVKSTNQYVPDLFMDDIELIKAVPTDNCDTKIWENNLKTKVRVKQYLPYQLKAKKPKHKKRKQNEFTLVPDDIVASKWESISKTDKREWITLTEELEGMGIHLSPQKLFKSFNGDYAEALRETISNNFFN